MKQVVQEIKLQNLSAKVAMKKMAYSLFICSRQMSVQEAVYLCLPELWLRKCQPGVMFLNSDLPHERIRLLKTEKGQLEMLEGSKDIYKSGIIEKLYRSTNNREVFGPYKFALQSLQQCIIKKFLVMIKIVNMTIYQIP